MEYDLDDAYFLKEKAYQGLINELRDKKQYKEAINLYKKALEEDTRSDVYTWASLLYSAQGLDYMSHKEYEKAIESFEEAIKINPKEGANYNTLALCYDYIHKDDEAIKFYKKGLELYANYKDLEEYPNWESFPKEMMDIIKNGKADAYASTYIALGIIYYQRKEYKKAIEVYEKSLEYKPNNEKVKGYLKDLYKKVNSTSS